MTRSLMMLAALALASTTAAAQDLQLNLRAGWTVMGEIFQLGGRTHGYGIYWGVIVEDNELEITSGVCPYIAIQEGDGPASVTGRCVWSDAAGDQIFTAFEGTINYQTGAYLGLEQTITGGTGKFIGISGADRILHTCSSLPQNPTQGTCEHHLNYRLP